MVFLGFENFLNNCKTVVSETGNDFKWHIVMRQNQLLISVVEQEVRMLRRVKIMVKESSGYTRRWDGLERKLFTRPCSCLGRNIILYSGRKFIV